MTTPTPATEPSAAVRKAGLLLPVLRRSAESWGTHHCAGELRRAIELIEELSAPAAAVGGDGKCSKCGAPTDPDYGHVGSCHAAPAGGFVVPDGLLDRIKAAEQRIQDNRAPRRIPADVNDVDLVLAEVRYLLQGEWPPFWIAYNRKSPTAQPSAIVGPAQTESEFQRVRRVVGDIRRGVEVKCVNDNPAAQPSAKDGVRVEGS